ncbi:MAG: hypothetical protein CL567_01135 [Alphaproteobacteria bacterium]|nr:hypothetical protein [Alphaproteobacteria bacterium]
MLVGFVSTLKVRRCHSVNLGLTLFGLSLLLFIASCSPPTEVIKTSNLTYDANLQKSLTSIALPQNNFKFDYFISDHGYSLRYGFSLVDESRGTIVIAPGQSEFIEGYFELINDFNQNNYDVWIMDWHGQGGSDHALTDYNRAGTNFKNDQDDIKKFISQIVVYEDHMPPIIFAHSMGAHILLGLLSSGQVAIDRAVLSAPMITVKTGLFPHGLSSFVAGFASTLGLGWWYAPGNNEWIDDINYAANDNQNTSDSERSFLKQKWRRSLEHTRKSYGVTLMWFNNYVNSRKRIFNSSVLPNTKTKILMTIPEIDVLVVPEDSLKLCSKIINCRSIFYKGARHELYLERNGIREKWLGHIYKWLNSK